MFNKKLGKKIDSKVMMATATDAMGDVVTTTATIASVLFFRITGINIDGIVGIGAVSYTHLDVYKRQRDTCT